MTFTEDGGLLATLSVQRKPAFRIIRGMNQKTNPEQGRRIAAIRKQAGLSSQSEMAMLISRYGGGDVVSRGAVGNWEQGKGVKLENLQAIVKSFPKLGITVDWLSSGANPPDWFESDQPRAQLEARPPAPTVIQDVDFDVAVVRGNVAAGVWMDDGDWDGHASRTLAFPKDKYPGVPKQAYRVFGDSMDKLGILDGGWAIAVEYWVVRGSIIADDIVVVERRQSARVERTIKRVVSEDGHFWLYPESSNAEWKPIKVPNGGAENNDEEITIVGLVVGYHRTFG